MEQKKTAAECRTAQPCVLEVLLKTVDHFFPDFNKWLKGVNDPRDKAKITYPTHVLLWVGILLFMLKLESRRQINYLFNTVDFVSNLEVLTGEELKKIAYDGTLAELAEKLEPEALSDIITKMNNQLIRKRCLEKYRLLDTYYIIAHDGTGHLSFKEKHCDKCLVQRRKGGEVLHYYHNVLDAKLIAGNGMALSFDTEFIENEFPGASRQDCELNAFYRMAPRIRKNFPQLPVCMVLDGLYAAGPVFDVCEKNRFKYIIVFQEGSMSAVYKDYCGLKLLETKNTARVEKDGITQDFNWVNGIDYDGRKLNVLECNETGPGAKGRIKPTKHVWLTNLKITHDNFKSIAEGGRMRWKVENEGFNMQKNGGYNLEHAYSEHTVAAKIFYLLLQIAHILNQLMEKGSLLKEHIARAFGSLRNVARKLLEEFRTKTIDAAKLLEIRASKYQIRFVPNAPP